MQNRWFRPIFFPASHQACTRCMLCPHTVRTFVAAYFVSRSAAGGLEVARAAIAFPP